MALFNIFKKKSAKLRWPYHFAIIKLSDSAKMNGIVSDENKKILEYKGGVLVREIKYDSVYLGILEGQGIPVSEVVEDKDKFNFIEKGQFGEVTVIR